MIKNIQAKSSVPIFFIMTKTWKFLSTKINRFTVLHVYYLLLYIIEPINNQALIKDCSDNKGFHQLVLPDSSNSWAFRLRINNNVWWFCDDHILIQVKIVWYLALNKTWAMFRSGSHVFYGFWFPTQMLTVIFDWSFWSIL